STIEATGTRTPRFPVTRRGTGPRVAPAVPVSFRVRRPGQRLAAPAQPRSAGSVLWDRLSPAPPVQSCGAAGVHSPYAASLSTAAAPAATPVTVSTAGQAPIFFASGCESPKPSTYVAPSTAVVAAPRRASQVRPAYRPAAPSAIPPRGRIPVSRAMSQPPIRPAASTGAALTAWAGWRDRAEERAAVDRVFMGREYRLAPERARPRSGPTGRRPTPRASVIGFPTDAPDPRGD